MSVLSIEHMKKAQIKLKRCTFCPYQKFRAKIGGTHPKKYVRGNARLSMGLYRTPEEADRYIEEALKRPLP